MRHAMRLALLASILPHAASAQDTPKVELFGGYSFTRSEDTNLHGFETSLALNLGRSFGAVLDLSGHYATVEGVDVSRTFFLAGPRLSRRGDDLTLCGQVLVGAVRTSAGIEVLGVSISEKSTDPAGTVGAGVDFKVAGSWAVRLQGELAVIRGDGRTATEPRASLGIVYRAGKR
jgi:opacity protein-like surface antigen